MLLKIAWRNIWRNKRRSTIILGSIIVGVVAILFMDAFMNGFVKQMLFNQININVGHVQVHNNGFTDNKTIKNYIADHQTVEDAIQSSPTIKSYSKRAIAFGIVSSASNSSGIYMYGVVPDLEKETSLIDESIIKGEFLSGGKHEILIGKKIADKLNVDIDDKVVCMSNRLDGSIGSEVFRVKGIFSTTNSGFDGSYIYTNLSTIQSMLELGNNVHEYSIVVKDYKKASIVSHNLAQKLDSKYEVKSYKELLPLLLLQIDMTKQLMFIVNLIIGLAIAFGIINTMLMIVFERIREIGVLMSIGMKTGKIFILLILEAVALGAIGTLLGFAIGTAIILPLSSSGVDLTLFAKSLTSLGTGSIIFPELNIDGILTTLLVIPIITVLGALYPAYKAIKLEPVYAVNYV